MTLFMLILMVFIPIASIQAEETTKEEVHGLIQTSVFKDGLVAGSSKLDLSALRLRLAGTRYFDSEIPLCQFEIAGDLAAKQPKLLDAYLRLHFWRGLDVRAGRLKIPFSAEYLLPTEDLKLPRARIAQLTPAGAEGRAIGGEVTGSVTPALRATLGVFQEPEPSAAWEGVSRVVVQLIDGLDLNAAYAWQERTWRQAHWLDASFLLRRDHAGGSRTTVGGEVLFVSDGRQGWHLTGAHRFRLPGLHLLTAIEPDLRYESVNEQGGQRDSLVSLALNLEALGGVRFSVYSTTDLFDDQLVDKTKLCALAQLEF